ncbi:putative hemolysin [Alcaligenes sp. SDU_A2]|uniref:putative hemolysin n=1 Tax=Alcaligenes sp. SDU_A2 TaxID=3136634 RepID=UPI00311DF0F2
MFYRLLSVCAGSMLLAACASSDQRSKTLSQVNPASAFCQRMGGQSVLHQGPRGAYGTCLMQDGSETEEWAFYRTWFPRQD